MSKSFRVTSEFSKARFALYGLVIAMGSMVALLSSLLWMRLSSAVVVVVVGTLAGFDFYRTVPTSLGKLLRTQRELISRLESLLMRQEAASNRLDNLSATVSKSVRIMEEARAAAESARLVVSAEEQPSDLPHVLFLTSNGSGLGHLTRLSAIADAGSNHFTSSFVSLSTAAELLTDRGYDVTKIESQSTSGLTWTEWNRRFSQEFDRQLLRHNPQAVVFDGVQMFRGVHERSAARGIPVIWVCRGLWKPSSDRSQVRRWQDIAVDLLVPSEGNLIANEESHPAPESGGTTLEPVVLRDVFDPLDSDHARQALSLESERKYVLVQIGSGAQGNRDELIQSAILAVNQLGDEWIPVLLSSPLASTSGKKNWLGRFETRSKYPVAGLLNAFEFSIIAAGYNSVHESIAAEHPAVYVPEARMLTDDQVRRAEAVVAAGAGELVRETTDMGAAVRRIADQRVRSAMKRAARGLRVSSGSNVAAEAIRSAIGRQASGLKVQNYGAERKGFL